MQLEGVRAMSSQKEKEMQQAQQNQAQATAALVASLQSKVHHAGVQYQDVHHMLSSWPFIGLDSA